MDEHLKQETRGLVRSWMRHDEARLRDYLVADVEDPRINVQSILTRHFLVEGLFGNRFAALQETELRFAAAMNWLLKFLKSSALPEDAAALLHGLSRGADNAEGIEIPGFASRLFATLPTTVEGMPVPNYIRDVLDDAQRQPGQTGLADARKATCQLLWRQLLEREKPRGASVLEPACGSANDYRFLDAFGIARLVRYSGFDLCEKNVRNAKSLFPQASFEIGNVFEVAAPDQAFDFCFVHDLFEHLSVAAMETAIAEICRVTRKGICVGFFRMAEKSEHIITRVDDYHYNTLSMARTRELFLRHGLAVQVIHIGTFLERCFQCPETHNQGAYTFVVMQKEECRRS